MAAKAKSKPRRKRARKGPVPPSARRVRGGLPCPECDFVAKHAMGLGRHRSARHGVVSRRSVQRGTTGGRWVTRQQAADRADVHYNTVRQWEQAGIVRTAKRPGVRGMLLSADDLERFLVERGGYEVAATGAGSDVAVRALQGQYDRLITDLERLLEAARNARPEVSSGGAAKRRKGAGRKKAAVKKRAPAKRGGARRKKATAKKRAPAKRRTGSRRR